MLDQLTDFMTFVHACMHLTDAPYSADYNYYWHCCIVKPEIRQE